MDRTLSSQEEKEANVQYQSQLKHYAFLKQSRSSSRKKNPFFLLKYWASKSLRNLHVRPKMSSGFGSERFHFNGMVVNNSAYCASPCSSEENMESLLEKREGMGDKNDEIGNNDRVGVEVNAEESGESSSSSCFLASEITVNDEEQSSTEDSSSPPSMVWPIKKDEQPHYASSHVSGDAEKPHSDSRKLEKQGSSLSGKIPHCNFCFCFHCLIRFAVPFCQYWCVTPKTWFLLLSLETWI